MEAHARLSKKGFNVASFGTGDKVSQRVLRVQSEPVFRWSYQAPVLTSPTYTSSAQATVKSGQTSWGRTRLCTSRMASCTCWTGRCWRGRRMPRWPGTGQSNQHLRGFKIPPRGLQFFIPILTALYSLASHTYLLNQVWYNSHCWRKGVRPGPVPLYCIHNTKVWKAKNMKSCFSYWSTFVYSKY